MALTSYFTRIGAAKVKLPVVQPATVLPALTSLVFLACTYTPTQMVVNDINTPLAVGSTYRFILAALGADIPNGGLSISGGSPISGTASIANVNQAFLINVAASNFPNNLNQSFAMGVWMDKNQSGNFALQGYYVIDRSGNDFNAWITCEPLVSQTTYTAANLQAIVQDNTNFPELGSRVPVGCTFSTSLRTTGGVEVGRNVDTVNVNPDNSSAYPYPLNRGYSLRFSLLPNLVTNVVQANAGKTARGLVPFGHTVQTANMSLQTAVALTTGNVPFQLILPPDNTRSTEIRYYLASVSTNLSGASERWTKDNTTPLTFQVQTVNLDPLLNDVDVELSYTFTN